MSWSVSQIGKAFAVAERVAAEIARIKCIEPEETVKNHVGAAIAAALAAYPADFVVEVEASGSQYSPSGHPVNSLSVKVRPIHGFVE